MFIGVTGFILRFVLILDCYWIYIEIYIELTNVVLENVVLKNIVLDNYIVLEETSTVKVLYYLELFMVAEEYGIKLL